MYFYFQCGKYSTPKVKENLENALNSVVYSTAISTVNQVQNATEKKEELDDTQLIEEKDVEPPSYPNPYAVLNPHFISICKSVCYLHSYYHQKKINLEDVLKLFV